MAAYVFIVKKLKDHIKNRKYYEAAKLKNGGRCWQYIAHLSARAHKYTHFKIQNARYYQYKHSDKVSSC